MPDQESTTATIYPSLYYDDAAGAIEWLSRAFGFRKRLVVPGPDGTIIHSELTLGPGVIMVGSARPGQGYVGPRSLQGVPQVLSVQVDDPDAHHARATAAGARVLRELQDEDYGSRGYMVEDVEGHHWYFGTYRPGAHWTE